MSTTRNKPPFGPEHIDQFDELIDARSPAEFAIDHLPGATNCSALDDEQRRIVGTLYKQVGAFEARRLGAGMVAENLARHLRERFADKPANWRPLVYCWRGGLRSGSMVTWLRLVGWDAQQLHGGYKAWRRYVMAQIDALSPQLDLRIIMGATGSAKTRLLHALREQGAQMLDLEGLAAHKGSVLGGLPGQPQPSQTAFETQLFQQLRALDPARPVYVEGESRRIGLINVPEPLILRMRAAPCIEVDATSGARLAYLLRDYAYLGDDRERLAGQLARLTALQGHETVHRWQGWAQAGKLTELFAELMARHYDPLYARSQHKNYLGWPQRQVVRSDDLTDAGIAQLAAQVLALSPAATPSAASHAAAGH